MHTVDTMATISVRVSDDLANRLTMLAKGGERSRSQLAAQAVEAFVAAHEWQLQAIQEGVAAANRGEIVPHDAALAELDRWGGREA